MGLPHDPLHQPTHLPTYEGVNPTQASLRRAVSTAYYALFHLLIEDAASHWSGSPEGQTGMERGFQHGPMKNTAIQFKKQTWQDWHGNQRAIPLAIQNVATAFVKLQEERHIADYDNHEQWTITDVQAALDTARLAFQQWQSIPTDPMPATYLLAIFPT